MLYDLGLIFTSVVYGWIACDLLLARGWRARFPGIAVAAASVGLWAAGELIVGNAVSPEEKLNARRLLFAGVCALGPAWFFGAAQATRAPWLRHARWMLPLVALPELIAYASFYFDMRGLFVDWDSRPLQRGPLFTFHAFYSWALLIAGFVLLGRHLGRLSPERHHSWLIGLAGGIPLLANIAYLRFGWFASDPTPIALGAVAVWLRFLLVDSGLAPQFLPFARREVIEQLSAGLLVSDASGVVVDANAAAAELAGVADPLGMQMADVIERAQSHPLRIIEVHQTPLEHGAVRFGTSALLEDRTEIAAAARRLEVATRFEALGFLIAGVAHEINNPLGYVRGNLGLMQTLVASVQEHDLARQLPPRTARLAREADAIVGDAIDGADRIAALVRRLSGFTRDANGGEAGEVEMSLIVRQAIDMASMGRSPDQVVISHEDEVPVVIARGDDMVQVVLHLLINAIQAGAKDSPVEIELREAAGGVIVRVLDRGPGIPEQLLPHIFDPFFTTKTGADNMGLGLSLSYDLARQSGGTLEAEPREGGGAILSLLLPGLGAGAGGRDDDAG